MSQYLLGTDAPEQTRLGLQHELWSAVTHEVWNHAGIALGDHVLDVGSGPGYATVELARRVGPRGSVLAVDSSEDSIQAVQSRCASMPWVNTEVTSVERFEPADATFDSIFARWLFCFLREPRELVERLARALRPGGCLMVIDYFHYDAFNIAPPAPIMRRLVNAVQQSWTSAGGSLQVGGHLPTWLAEVGLHVRQVRPHVVCARPGDPMWHWPMTFFETFVDQLVSEQHLTKTEAIEVRELLRERSENPNAFILTPPVISIVAQKP